MRSGAYSVRSSEEATAKRSLPSDTRSASADGAALARDSEDLAAAAPAAANAERTSGMPKRT